MSASEIEPREPGPTREVVPRSAERFPASASSSSASPSLRGPRTAPPSHSISGPSSDSGLGADAAASSAASIAAGFAAKLAAREAAMGSSDLGDPTDAPGEGAPGDRSTAVRGEAGRPGARGASPAAGTRLDPTRGGLSTAVERRANDTASPRGREVRAAGRGRDGAPADALRWHRMETIPETIRETLGEGLAYANCLVDRAREHPELSVHEYRKTVRRMRAIVKLLRHLIGPRAYLSLETGLRSAVAPTSGLRDSRILLGALELATPAGGSEELRESLAGEWRARLAELEAGDEEARVLAASRAPLARIAGELQSALPATITRAELRMAVARSYRKARRAFREAAESGEESQVHAARKRAKELRYQLEWLAQVSAKRVRRRWKRLSALAQELGEVTDLAILERAVHAHAPAAAPFARGIRELAVRRWEEVVEERGRLFAERPRKFARGVAKRA